QAGKVLPVQRIRSTEVQRDAVRNDRIAVEDRVQVAERFAPGDHEVFTDDFEEIDRRPVPEKVGIVRHAQADADAEIAEAVALAKAADGHAASAYFGQCMLQPP